MANGHNEVLNLPGYDIDGGVVTCSWINVEKAMVNHKRARGAICCLLFVSKMMQHYTLNLYDSVLTSLIRMGKRILYDVFTYKSM